jgi:5-formyltetrahydrofolate cyclo-ligase
VTFSEKKQGLRQTFRRIRQALPPAEREKAAQTIASQLAALSKDWPSGIIAGYWPMGSEIDLRPALIKLETYGLRLALPVINGQSLLFRSYKMGGPLHQGPLQTREPSPDHPLCSPAVMLVPVLAFDDRLMRLGQGAGFYDRTLADLRQNASVLSIGLAFDCQRAETIPAEPHDQPLDLVVTEQSIYTPHPDR